MKVNLKKRVICYIVDLFIISIICLILSMIIPKSDNYINIQNWISNISSDYLNNEITFSSYFNLFSELSNKLDRSNVFYMSACFGFTIIYFILIPLFLKGRTLGMLICKLNLKVNKNMFTTVLIRGLISYGILFYLLQLLIMYFILDKNYLLILTFLAFIQILVVILSSFMIKYRDDKRSLADILSSSNILIES